ncbi:hypothetical protein BU24DRAFT_252541 [Aaosphaeria arxii CBS 175.79]|uniref:N-acetyltransferase domain-containing protein n=1 Tax=Aaosphaeria arxii CBS 175.79 TaxID=1450172 RepID=A0A6A5XHW4_9PLEO|nr:uncharacterized protein BU24DRAFT_252541 [Aaosphaeria arxii CBS 175.79]KAF2012456.1 hypothetical protein BU24DRAFT_252541 [Aaosphaeria arxii CBS 175.79]
MDPVLVTPRLKLTLLSTLEPGSPELALAHELRSDPQSTFWSPYGTAKTIEDTKKVFEGVLNKKHTINYLIHRFVNPSSSNDADQEQRETEFIGHVTIWPLGAGSLPLPENLSAPAAESETTLSMEVGYMFLPKAWGKGYATESLNAVFGLCKRERGFWAPYEKVYVRALVNDENAASMRVMEKVGFEKRGVHHWTGDKVFLAGKWITECGIAIYGTYLVQD